MNNQLQTGYQKYIYDNEFEQIVEWVNKKIKSPSMKMLLRFLMFTGCPPVDAVNIKTSNFNKDYSRAEFIRKKTARYQRIYTAHIPDFLSIELREYIKNYGACFKDEYIFPASCRNQSKNPHIQTGCIGAVFSRLRRDLGFEETYYETKNNILLHRITPYSLRHYCAQRIYYASGRDILAVREYLNHQKTETTGRYVKGFIGNPHTRGIINSAFTKYAEATES